MWHHRCDSQCSHNHPVATTNLLSGSDVLKTSKAMKSCCVGKFCIDNRSIEYLASVIWEGGEDFYSHFHSFLFFNWSHTTFHIYSFFPQLFCTVWPFPRWPVPRHSRTWASHGAWRVAGRPRRRSHSDVHEGGLHTAKEPRAQSGEEERAGLQTHHPAQHVHCGH